MTSVVSLLAGVCLAAVSFAPTAIAQTSDLVRVHLAEPVTVGSTHIPAGDYEVRDLGFTAEEGILQFHSGSFTAVVTAEKAFFPTSQESDRTDLVLHRADGKLVLDRIVLGSRDYRYAFHAKP